MAKTSAVNTKKGGNQNIEAKDFPYLLRNRQLNFSNKTVNTPVFRLTVLLFFMSLCLHNGLTTACWKM